MNVTAVAPAEAAAGCAPGKAAEDLNAGIEGKPGVGVAAGAVVGIDAAVGDGAVSEDEPLWSFGRVELETGACIATERKPSAAAMHWPRVTSWSSRTVATAGLPMCCDSGTTSTGANSN